MADADYVIQIAAQMPDGLATIEQLDKITASLTGAGKRGADFQTAMASVSTQLDAATRASVAANASLAEGSDHYRTLERDAVKASKALERANGKGFVPLDVQRQAQTTNAALQAYTPTLKALEDKALGATTAQAKLAQQLANVRKVADHVDARNGASMQKYERLSQAAGLLPPQLRMIAQRGIQASRANEGLTATFGGATARTLLLAGAVIGVTVAVIAATAAAIAGAVAWSKYAISQADSARTAALTNQAFSAMSAENAAAASSFGTLTEQTGLGTKELQSLTKTLIAAKVTAADLPEALEAAALAEAALGSGGSAAFVKDLQAGERAVSDLAAEARTKLGGIVVKQMAGLEAQGNRLSRLWDKLFAGLDIEPVLRAVNTLVNMFDPASASAQAFKSVIEATFGPIANNAEAAAFAIEAFVLGFQIQMMKIALAVKPAINWLRDLFGGEGFGLADTLGKAAAISFVVLAGALGLAAAALGIIVGAIGLAAAALGGLVYGLYEFVKLSVELNLAFAEMGINLMKGLANGIVEGTKWVVDSITAGVSKAIDAAKGLLGIHSPSTVFADIGGNTAEGFAVGVEDGTPHAQDSLANLVATPVASEGTAPAAKAEGRSVSLSGVTFAFYGVEGAEGARISFAETLTRILEGDADSLNGAVV